MEKKKQEIAESLALQATRIGRGAQFWDKMAEAVVTGKIKGIDPRTHLRSPQRPEKIAKHIHELIGDKTPYSQVHKKIRHVYLQLVKLVMEDLDW